MNYKLDFQQRNITILNNLALAPLIYVSSIIETPIKAIREINIAIQNVTWDGSTSNISQRTFIQSISNGGLNLCHFETKMQSLQLSWVKRLTSASNHKWKLLPRKYFVCINL